MLDAGCWMRIMRMRIMNHAKGLWEMRCALPFFLVPPPLCFFYGGLFPRFIGPAPWGNFAFCSALRWRLQKLHKSLFLQCLIT
jgi:hypothetical protein